MIRESSQSYLAPYREAVARHGAAFRSLLWASPKTQRVRFEAMARLYDFAGRLVLDVGCGRADLLEFLLSERPEPPLDYTGIEAMEPLAAAAEQRVAAAKGCTGRIVQADFVTNPARMLVGADVVVFSGSLNTMEDTQFYTSLSHAFDAATEAVIFNFLSSPALAGQRYLHWREPADVIAFARSLGNEVVMLDDYLHGDCTVVVRKREEP